MVLGLRAAFANAANRCDWGVLIEAENEDRR